MSTSIQEEIVELNKSLAQLQDRLGELSKRIAEEGHDKLRDLEAENERLKRGVKRMRTIEADLRRKAKAHEPDLEKAVEARDGAIRKLRHARRLIKDLLEEKEKAEVNRSNAASPAPSVISMGSLEDIVSSKSSSSSAISSSDSGKTIRGKNSGRKANSQRTVSPMPPATDPSLVEKQQNRRADLSARATPRTTDGERSRTMSPSMSVTPGSPTSSLRSESEKIMLHFSRPPRSTKFTLGPFSWQDLRRIFKLDDETIGGLQRLKSDEQLRMRVLFLTNFAFVYDPIFGESGDSGQQKSFLFDWGDKESNEEIINHITAVGDVYHTFVFPLNKDKWYYLGALTWQPADSQKWAVWPSLREEARTELVRKLQGRSGTDDGVEERMETGEAEQITFEISGLGHDHLSQQLATSLRDLVKVN